MKLDFYTSMGFAAELLHASEYHKKLSLGEFFCDAVLPPLSQYQAHFVIDSKGRPTAFVTWAWVSPEVEKELHVTGRYLLRNEWNCGPCLFFNDWITPYGNIRDVVRHMTENVFPNESATSIRRYPDGRVRRICRWTGANLRPKRFPTTKFADDR